MEVSFFSRFEIKSLRGSEKTGNFGRLLFESEGFGHVRFIIITSGTVGDLFGFIFGIKRNHGIKAWKAFNRWVRSVCGIAEILLVHGVLSILCKINKNNMIQ